MPLIPEMKMPELSMPEFTLAKGFFYDWAGGNEELFLVINSIRGVTYDKLMVMISKMADHDNAFYYLFALFIWVFANVVVRTLRRKTSVAPYVTVWVGIFAVLIFSIPAQAGLIKTIKTEFAYPRPYMALPADQVHVIDYEPEPENAYRSFPSGHVAFATLWLVALWPVLTTLGCWIGVGLIPLVGWSRIAMGMHFPADVLYAFLISFILVLIIRSAVYRVLRSVFGMRC